MKTIHTAPSLDRDGWVLDSAEKRASATPHSFLIPDRSSREGLQAGDAAQLLFFIETREGGNIVDLGTDRMWVLVKSRTAAGYVGVLDNDPGNAENLNLREGDLIVFGPEHICSIDAPPKEYIAEKYGQEFFEV